MKKSLLFLFTLFMFSLIACTRTSDIKMGMKTSDTEPKKGSLVKINGFYMDASEINSNEYRQYPVKNDSTDPAEELK